MKAYPWNSLLRPTRRAAACVLAVLGLAPVLAAQATPAAEAKEAADRAAESISSYQQEGTDANQAKVKTALNELDAEIEHLKRFAEAAPDAAQRQAAEQRVKHFAERRDELRREHNQTRFDELRADVRREWTEFKGWVRGDRKQEDRAEGKPAEPKQLPRVPDTGDYVRTPEAGGAPVAVNRASTGGGRPTAPARGAPPDQTLDQLDSQLAQLEQRIERLEAKDQRRWEARVKQLKERRRELEQRYTSDRHRSLRKAIESAIEQAGQAAE